MEFFELQVTRAKRHLNSHMRFYFNMKMHSDGQEHPLIIELCYFLLILAAIRFSSLWYYDAVVFDTKKVICDCFMSHREHRFIAIQWRVNIPARARLLLSACGVEASESIVNHNCLSFTKGISSAIILKKTVLLIMMSHTYTHYSSRELLKLRTIRFGCVS